MVAESIPSKTAKIIQFLAFIVRPSGRATSGIREEVVGSRWAAAASILLDAKCRVVQDVTLLTAGPLSFQRYKRAVQGSKVESRTIDGVGESGFLVR
jgi:hypothetical protein